MASLAHYEIAVGPRPRLHVVSLDASSKDLEVELVYGGQTWRAALQGGKPMTTPRGAPQAFILRRTDITRVMESTAGERYKTLQAYISVPKVERAEGELRRAAKAVNDEVNKAVTERRIAEDALERFWQAEGRPGLSPYEWSAQKTQEDTALLTRRLAAARTLVGHFDRLADARERIIAANQELALTQDRVEQAKTQMQQAREREMGDSNELLAVLEEARHYFAEDSTDIDACPVCGRPERRDRLVQRVDQELQRLSALKQVRDEWAESVKAVERAEGVLDEARRHLRGCAEHFVDALNRSPASVAAGFGELADLLAKAQGTTVRHVASAIDTAMPYRVTLTALIDEDQKTINQLSAIKTYVQTLTTSDRAMRELQRLAIRMTRILEVVEDERKRFVSELMDRIAQSVDELYGRMHPNESLGRPRFHVKAQAAGSLEMKANFGNKADVPPTAYYSEAHLDTLGLCVYLALAKHSTGGNALLVLDDVLTSVDDVHLDRIIDLIVEESVHFGQLIITTHSRVVRPCADGEGDVCRLD